MLVYLVLAATNEARDMRTSSYEVPLAVGICVFVVHLVLVNTEIYCIVTIVKHKEMFYNDDPWTDNLILTLQVPLTGCGINPVRGLMPSVIADDVRSYHWVSHVTTTQNYSTKFPPVLLFNSSVFLQNISLRLKTIFIRFTLLDRLLLASSGPLLTSWFSRSTTSPVSLNL